MSTKIQWTEETWNPIGGCFKVSPGCKNCYAIRQAVRLAGNPNKKIRDHYDGLTVIQGGQPNWSGEVTFNEQVLLQPLKRRKPTTYFISLSDLFYDNRPDADILAVLQMIGKCQQHRFQILTKYPDRASEFLSRRRWRNLGYMGGDYYVAIIPGEHREDDSEFLPNVHLGVSVENQQYADQRIPKLLVTPAALRFVSYEPALGPVDFSRYLEGLDWIIVGGESGPGARPFDIAWARQTIRQCREAAVPCFVKQLGAVPIIDPCRQHHWDFGEAIGRKAEHLFSAMDPMRPSTEKWRIHFEDKKAGDPAEWPTYLRVRQVPEVRP